MSGDDGFARGAAARLLGGEASGAALTRFLEGLPPVDGRAVERTLEGLPPLPSGPDEAASLDAIVAAIDLTSLDGEDTAWRIRALAGRAVRPDPEDASCPATAAVCVYPDLVPAAVEGLGSARGAVAVAAVAGAFPSGRTTLAVKLLEVREAVAAGADEVDVVLDRAAFLSGEHARAHDELVALREACRARPGAPARLKVILECGRLGGADSVRRAAWLAMIAGADFVKTSTGKVEPAARLEDVVVLAEAVRDFAAETGRRVGVKPAGGIRRLEDAHAFLAATRAVAGADGVGPESFRIGASGLLSAVVERRRVVRGLGQR